MGAILEMDLKVLDGGVRASCVRFPGAVAAPYARQPGELDVGRQGFAGGRGDEGRDEGVSVGVDGAVPHHGLEGVGRVGLEEGR